MILVLEPEKLVQRIVLGLGVVTLTIAAGFAARYVRLLKTDLDASQATVVKLQTEISKGTKQVKDAHAQLETASAQIKKVNAESATHQAELKRLQREREVVRREQNELASQRAILARDAEERAQRSRQVAAEQTVVVKCMEVVSVGRNYELVRECVLPNTRR